MCVREALAHFSHSSENFTTLPVSQPSLTATLTAGGSGVPIIYPVRGNVSVSVHEHQSGPSRHVPLLMSQLVSATPLFILNVSAVGDESRGDAILKRFPRRPPVTALLLLTPLNPSEQKSS